MPRPGGRHWIVTAYLARRLAEGAVEWQRNYDFKYDREADILHIGTCQPYPEQESGEELGDEVVARLNPKTGEIEKTWKCFSSRRGSCATSSLSCLLRRISGWPIVRSALRSLTLRGRDMKRAAVERAQTLRVWQRHLVSHGPGPLLCRDARLQAGRFRKGQRVGGCGRARCHLCHGDKLAHRPTIQQRRSTM